MNAGRLSHGFAPTNARDFARGGTPIQCTAGSVQLPEHLDLPARIGLSQESGARVVFEVPVGLKGQPPQEARNGCVDACEKKCKQ